MKKVVILVFLAIMLFAMSSAYAAWTDSVSVNVSAESAVILGEYVGRNNPSNVDYVRLNGSDVSLSNPYPSITETVTELYPNNYGSNSVYNGMYRVVYTIKNTGTVPIVIEGIDVSGFTVQAYSYYAGSLTWDEVMDTASIVYRLQVNGVNDRVVVNDIESSATVYFSNGNQNLLYPGDECTLRVKYRRSTTGDFRMDEYTWINILDKTDVIIFSVY